MVQVHLGPPPQSCGGVAQLGERLPCKQEAIGSIPFTSTTTVAARTFPRQLLEREERFFES